MYSLKKIFNYTKYNLIDKWGFIYLEKSLNDHVFTLPKREESIMEKEKFVQNLQQKYFGPEGELYKKRQDLISPTNGCLMI